MRNYLVVCGLLLAGPAWADEAAPPPLVPEEEPPAPRPSEPAAAARPLTAPLADRAPLPLLKASDCEAAGDQQRWLAAAQCWQLLAGERNLAERRQWAVALEAVGRLDEAVAQWKPILEPATGPHRIALERRVNALAEAELLLADLDAGRKPQTLKHLRSILTDFAVPDVAQWGPPPAWLMTVEAALAPAKAKAPRLVWRRGLPSSGDEVPAGIARTADGGGWIAARANLHEQGGYKLRLYRVDNTGRLRGQMTWGSGADDEPRAVHSGADGTAVVGRSTRTGQAQGWMVVFDSQKRPLLDISVAGAEELRSLQPHASGWRAEGSCGGQPCAWLIDRAGKATREPAAAPPAAGKAKKRKGGKAKAGPAAELQTWTVQAEPTMAGRRELVLTRWK
ncbi:MAG: hypothetical protein HY902_11675 [Deltaproteobacteria bacterium]|nr:hypothetical protein [Deltaproteobacteria bacterium]